MAWHLYMLPVELATGTEGNVRRPKYLTGVPFNMIDFGYEGACIVATDVDASTDAALVLNADVTKIPDNLDQTIGGALTAVQNEMEARNIPAGWVTSGMTYRFVVRTIIAVFSFIQRVCGLSRFYQALMSGGVTLDTTYGSLSGAWQQRILDAADSFSLDTSGLTGAATIRQILKNVADQLRRPLTLGGVEI